MSIIPDHYVPYASAADYLNLRPETVRKYIHSGVLKAEKLGNTYYLHRDEIQRYNRERNPVGSPGKKNSNRS